MHTHTQWLDRRCIKHAMQASLSLVARLPLVPPILAQGQNSQYRLLLFPQVTLVAALNSRSLTRSPFPSRWTTAPQEPTAFQLWETRPWNPRLEYPSPSHRHGHQPHLPRPQRQTNPAWAGQELAVRSQKQFMLKRMRSEAASVYHEAAPDGAAAGAASRVMPPPPPLQSPPDMGLIGLHNHYTRTRWAEWRDEFGRRWRISGVAVRGDLIHECWTIVEPDPAIECILSERLGPYIPALSTRVSGRRN